MLTRAVITAGVTLGALLLTATPALAGGGWGYTDCSQFPNPGCELGAGQSGGGSPANPPGHSSGRPGGHHPSGGSAGSGAPGPASPGGGDTLTGNDPNLANCTYRPSDYQPPTGATPVAFTKPVDPTPAFAEPAVFTRNTGADWKQLADAPAPGPGGAWYVYQCSGPGWHDALYRPPIWIPNGQQPGAAPGPSPAELAQQALQQLHLPSPQIAANPAGEQLVRLPTWLWLSGGWAPASATAAVPGVSVTAVATPKSVSWSMGDGISLTCQGPGTPFPSGGNPAAESRDCGHTYRSSSASQPRQAFPVTATVHWTVAWSGAGQGGTFPDMTTTSTAAFRVAESQALNTGG